MPRRHLFRSLVIAGILLALTACGQESGNSGGQLSYKDVKSMVIDILGSEDAQKALEKASTAQYGSTTLQMKSLSIQDQEKIKMTVKDVLTSPGYTAVLKNMMTDTKFAGEFAKAVSEDNKQIHKDLLKDPAYQQGLLEVFKTPEMTKLISDAMKGAEVRKLMMTTMTDAMKNPLFKMEVLKLLQEAVRAELNMSGNEQSAAPGSGDQQSQGSGGNEGDSGDSGDGGGGGGNSGS